MIALTNCCKLKWLKTTEIYHLKVMEVRNPKWVFWD